MPKINQRGIASILILLAAVGLISFLLISSSAGFKDKLFSSLYPKPVSKAVSDVTGAVFTASADNSSVTEGTQVTVRILMRSDTHKANLFSAKMSFDPTKLQVQSISSNPTFVTNWVENIFNNTTGKISIVGGVPKPGFSTSGTDAEMVQITFLTTAPGVTTISFDSTSAIYRNSDNINFLTVTNNASITITSLASPSPSPTLSPSPSPTPSPTPSPSPSPSPSPIACALNSAAWVSSINPVNEGAITTLTVLSNNNCLGESVHFEIREDDGLLGYDPVANNPADATFSSPDTLSTSWIAEYQPDGFNGSTDPPEYYFVATLLSDGSIITSGAPVLQVNKLPTTAYKRGDANRNNVVDLQDLSIMLSYWFDASGFPDEIDINDDGIINTFDFSGMLVILQNEGAIGSL